jgi:hypothetical protein
MFVIFIKVIIIIFIINVLIVIVGMVHAYVDQSLLKSNKIKRFNQ